MITSTAVELPWPRVHCPHRDHPPFQPVARDLLLAELNERRADRDQPDLAAQRAGVQHGSLAEPDHRDPYRGPRLGQAGFLEVADHEGVIALLLGGERVRDRLGRAPELGHRVRVRDARLNAEQLHVAGSRRMAHIYLTKVDLTSGPLSI
jgi:hypothetical protein